MWKFFLSSVFLFVPFFSQAQTIYVDADAGGVGDGSSWIKAYRYLQDSLVEAESTVKPVEIRVAGGIYKPDQGGHETAGDMEAYFGLISQVSIRGGYAGFGAADPDERDIIRYQAILSGDLAGNDMAVSDPCELLNEPSRTDNSYHVVYATGTDTTAVLDGVTISGGNCNREWPIYFGGGMLVESGSCTLLDCIFTGNIAAQGGAIQIEYGMADMTSCEFRGNAAIHAGAMLNGSSLTVLEDCKFIDNYAATSGGATICTDAKFTNCSFIENRAGYYGGGIKNDCSSPKLDNCQFIGNTTSFQGGGLYNYEGDLNIVGCVFSGNYASEGGGIYQGDTDSVITRCRFIENSATTGAGIFNEGYSDPVLCNCLFAGNVASIGAGFYNTTGSAPEFVNCTFSDNSSTLSAGGLFSENNYGTGMKLRNCILWDNDGQVSGQSGQISFQDGTPILNYCDVQGWTGDLGGAGNIDIEPIFADADNYDYHLKSQAGRWDSTVNIWVIDEVTSPCIDAGDMNTPVGPEPFPNGGIVNMGTFGGTEFADKSYFGEPLCSIITAGDINGDCMVDLADFTILAFHWMEDSRP